ncbi:hypothetical protein [Cellulophaga fucicola]|uniref:Uncharacterized protein n=1 Tax=Cellulophaga fucicola TaxID=76595 RepID=A0A1K1QTS9_9FLAO|nr:hypothetical protein [Cellulophaga fucicola]SFW63280.1 hypothetical protein SAMN05660313_02948 [Cellulophaga fucicola]
MALSKLKYYSLFFILMVYGCSEDSFTALSSLDVVLNGETVVKDNVIACAASADKEGFVNVFFYPREGATNFRCFETEDIEVDKNNFEAYIEKAPDVLDVFNGKLKRFSVETSKEKWVIVSFTEAGSTHISNPIQLKHITKPTERLNTVNIDSANPIMPIFTWQDGLYTDSAIYFQVITDVNSNFLSGTYTFEKMFQYYNLDNVVLNITKKSPPNLIQTKNYGFTLMAVSEDNWVNLLVETNFSP